MNKFLATAIIIFFVLWAGAWYMGYMSGYGKAVQDILERTEVEIIIKENNIDKGEEDLVTICFEKKMIIDVKDAKNYIR